MSLEGTADYLVRLVDEKTPSMENREANIGSAALGFRINGISPNQTAPNESALPEYSQAVNILISIALLALTYGLHVLAYIRTRSEATPSTRLQTLTMGLVGYIGVSVFTFLLLNLIREETTVEPLRLPEVFEDATWTFSDSRHSGHQSFDLPPARSLVHAVPATFSPGQKSRRHMVTLVLYLCLAVSFIVYYLGIRVAEWWVALGSLAIIWFSAGLRSLVMGNFLVAKHRPLEEHWLGAFQDTVYNSLLATVDTMANSAQTIEDPSPSPTQSTSPSNDEKGCVATVQPIATADPKSYTLIVEKPIRQSVKSWSGCEDVMKVSLEMAKHHCREHMFKAESRKLAFSTLPSFKRIIRFQLMIYVPGLIWTAETPLDYILTETFDFPNLYRDLLKIIYFCGDIKGQITRHGLSIGTLIKLSHVFCGPVTVPKDPRLHGEVTLTTLLSTLRKANRETEKAYTLEQAILLPVIQLAAMYESFPNDRTISYIRKLQNTHTDHLELSGAPFLPVLEGLFEHLHVWDSFMEAKSEATEDPCELKPRDGTSGLYGRYVRKARTPDEDVEQLAGGDHIADPGARNRLEPVDSHLYFEEHRPPMQLLL